MKNIENAVRSLLEFSAWMPRRQIPALLGLDATQPKEQLKSGKTLAQIVHGWNQCNLLGHFCVIGLNIFLI